MSLLEAKNLCISFSGTKILYDVDFHIKEHEINCLCGENGAGKSTLVKILSGVHPHYTGQIMMNGKEVCIRSPHDASSLGIYAIHQHRDLAPDLNAVENMFLCNESYIGKGRQRLDFATMKIKAKELIAKFEVDIDVDIPVQRLSVSEQGIIAICKALASDSKLLLIDEASAPLDDAERVTLYKTLRLLAEEGKGIVYITHHLDEVFRIGNTVTVLRDGYNVAKYNVDELDKAKLIAGMTGDAKVYSRELMCAGEWIGEKVIEVRNLYAEGLYDISLYARKGEILGIAGLEGSGKKTLALNCFGFKKYSKGEILKSNRVLNLKNPLDAIKNNIGLVPDNRKETGLVLCRNISDNIIIASINKVKQRIVLNSWKTNIARGFIQQLRIKCTSPSQLVEYLSGGNQQKVLVAKWIYAGVDVLFMIEPTEGIDVGARADLYNRIREIVKEGKTIIIITSDIDELMELSDRIITMAEGRIVNEYSIEEADKQTILTDILLKHKVG
ncbi:MAG: sugar ABC transporter ATP-binding protein [Sphaerochaeta sp.]|nr:sugar ABC transporter ATP-binding protein [Sphaerochaeta sp.]